MSDERRNAKTLNAEMISVLSFEGKLLSFFKSIMLC